MGSAKPVEVGSRLFQAEIAIHSQPHLGGVSVLLPIILPPANGAQCQRSRHIKRLVTATGATKLWTHVSSFLAVDEVFADTDANSRRVAYLPKLLLRYESDPNRQTRRVCRDYTPVLMRLKGVKMHAANRILEEFSRRPCAAAGAHRVAAWHKSKIGARQAHGIWVQPVVEFFGVELKLIL
jgi:hypothetical protein